MMGSSVAPNPLWDGLQGYWNADNNPNDSKGTYNGVLTNGATYGTGIINNGFSFDGVNDLVNMGDVLDIRLDSWTYNMWVKPTVVGSLVMLLGKATPLFNVQRWWIMLNAGGKVQFLLQKDGGIMPTFTGNTTIVAGIETMISVVVNRNGPVKIYVNGVEEIISVSAIATNNITSFNTFDFNTTYDLAFGAFYNSHYPYNGIIDEISIFKAIKTQSEITELYNGGEGLQYIP